eukprot:TRINITY_DN4931_c1_g1_i1.p2 TRINITY_DN4931_c1_g1~~TRINITY_DN4931_c1_g1_i1.p2  ORF type:complete len:257 (-),score=15.03 TRINITY_DN4931_c1_g1_i1:478-1248(-)
MQITYQVDKVSLKMGLDGGTYITRADVIRGQSWRLSQADTSRSTRGGSISTTKTYEVQTSEKGVQLAAKWSTCSLSGEKLQSPIVMDYLGSLYNKSAVLEFLLSKKNIFVNDQSMDRYYNQQRASKFGYEHLQTIKDVFEVHFTPNTDKEDPGKDFYPPYVCPVTDLRCGVHPFSALSKCGHAFSDRAIREMKDGRCATCSSKFQSVEDVIPINGTQEQVDILQQQLQTRQTQKRQRKRKRDTKVSQGLEGKKVRQ